MSNIIPLKASTDVPATLRRIADQVESGEIETKDGVTVAIPPYVYHMGTWDDAEAARAAVFNMTFAISRIMEAGASDD